MTTRVARCKDCPPDSKRPVVPGPGPRCATHARERRKATGAAAWARQLLAKFRITADEYWAIYEFQGGRCALCRLATGKARRLAVDHDHALAREHDHPVDQGCRLCIRGLLCKRCNRFGVPLVFEVILRALEYLADPPARKVLGRG